MLQVVENMEIPTIHATRIKKLHLWEKYKCSWGLLIHERMFTGF
tara:strand:+ start:159 stop:290 length:132 start_codon:yes stop_codon:yes gene_type:complete